MEKQIKMSLETAQVLWKSFCSKATPEGFAMFSILTENFTKEELEGKKGFSWEDSVNGEGWFINDDSRVSFVRGAIRERFNYCVFKTEAQAKSALAFAQLSHIVAKYNEGKECGRDWFTVDKVNVKNPNRGLKVSSWSSFDRHLSFYNKEDAEISLEVNRELWEQYWMIK